MSRLNVWLENKPCGFIDQTPQGDLKFQYFDSYTDASTPLSLSMPIGHLDYPKNRILPFLKGLLPDNENALQSIAKRFGANARNPFSLLKFIGRDVAGALQILPPNSKPTDYSDELSENSTEPLSDRQISELLFSRINEYEDATVNSSAGGLLSLAGAQAKLVLCRDADGNFTLPDQKHASTHIIKPVPTRWQNLDVVEHQTMLAAASLGLNVAKTEISLIGGYRVFITERFDRQRDANGEVERVHQEDICQAMAVDPAKKNQRNEGGPGVAAIAALFEELRHEADRESCSMQFFDALAFNTLALCTDAHAKNYSLMLSQDRVRFAPLYDLASTVLYTGLTNYAAMSIGGEYRFSDITSKGWQSEIAKLSVNPDWANERLAFIRSNLQDAFSQAGARIRSATDNLEISRTTNALTDALAQATK